MSIVFKKISPGDMPNFRWLRWLDAEIFPSDAPANAQLAHWFLAWDSKEAVAFCGWKPQQFGGIGDLYNVGFHYRAGVLPSYRGKGLQKEMITVREKDMLLHGFKKAVTYTEVASAASMTSLINMGYRPYAPDDTTALTTLDRYKQFVHWKKDL